jgi:hypothetical protein
LLSQKNFTLALQAVSCLADFVHQRGVGLRVVVQGERVLAGGEGKGQQRRALQAHGRLALVLGLAQVGVVAHLGQLGVDHQAIGAPDVRQAVHLALQGGVLLGRSQHRRDEQVALDLGQVHRLVDLEFLLRAGDAVLRRLCQVEAGATGGAQLGDHLLVVGQRDLDGVAGFLLELRLHLGRHVVGPGQQAQDFFLGQGGAGQAQCQGGGDERQFCFHGVFLQGGGDNAGNSRRNAPAMVMRSGDGPMTGVTGT